MISKTVKRITTLLLIIIFSLSAVGFGFAMGFKYVMSQNDRFMNFSEDIAVVDENTEGAMMVVIKRGADTSDIAEALFEVGAIKNKLAFVFFSKLNGFDGQYLAGTHFVLEDMTYDEIMYMLSLEPKTVKVTFVEGLTYTEVKETLNDAGVLYDEERLDSLVNDPSIFLDYDFVTEIPVDANREYLLQGYLFPDTYLFDMNTDEESIIRTFLNNTQRRLIPELYERAEHLGMTMDEVITLASVVQWEAGRIDEMDLVASVFHNRLNAQNHTTGNRLESCSTINYIKKERGEEPSLVVTYEEQNINSPYNTYRNTGLPIGPISSPGIDAIRATLWPAKTGYYYFVSKDDETGSSAFASTQTEHDNNVRYYLG